MQRLLTLRSSIDFVLPGRFGAGPGEQPNLNIINQRGIIKHRQVSAEYFPDTGHTGTVDQALNLPGDHRTRRL